MVERVDECADLRGLGLCQEAMLFVQRERLHFDAGEGRRLDGFRDVFGCPSGIVGEPEKRLETVN